MESTRLADREPGHGLPAGRGRPRRRQRRDGARGRGLQTYLFTRLGVVKAVDDVSFAVRRGETLAIVGESGCGKTMTALSLMRLVPNPPGRIVGGSIKLDGKDLVPLTEAEMRDVRGNEISMIFQEPMTSLNPVMTIGEQISETLRLHQDLSKSAALDRRRSRCCGWSSIPEPAQRAKEYPHQLSGGMRQRAMIAMALACNPQRADRRRADDRARRDDPGADPRSDPRPAEASSAPR